MLWQTNPSHREPALELASKLGISQILARCIVNRGISSPAQAELFLEPRLKHLADPFLLPNMDAAVTRLFQARTRGESLVVFGDYDVDGVTATAILSELFQALGLKSHVYLPHRLQDGYGLSAEAVEKCLQQFPVNLLLAVDCGSTSVAVIRDLQARGVDVIVLDHHKLADEKPPAVAVVNPQLGSDQDAFSFCSAGLAFKLAHALLKRGRQLGVPEAERFDLRETLDLVALGTVADVVPLKAENRLLVKTGLAKLDQSARPGIKALKKVSGIKNLLRVREVAFQLAPRLNAAGRLENALQALELLLAKETGHAEELAELLDVQNRERQGIEKRIAADAIQQLKARFDPAKDFALVTGNAEWHVGVVGIVASRILREFYRPTIVLGGDHDCWRGSGRSIPGFDLAAALRECSDLLLRHGGHAMAAGISILPENVFAFQERLNQCARTRLGMHSLEPSLMLDQEIRLDELTLELMHEIQRLEPFGQENPPAQFSARNVRLQTAPRFFGSENRHARFYITDGSTPREVVWWNFTDLAILEGTFDLAFTTEVNRYYPEDPRVQLIVSDVKPIHTCL